MATIRKKVRDSIRLQRTIDRIASEYRNRIRRRKERKDRPAHDRLARKLSNNARHHWARAGYDPKWLFEREAALKRLRKERNHG